eukprot:5417108-Amphidinium_carterae.1
MKEVLRLLQDGAALERMGFVLSVTELGHSSVVSEDMKEYEQFEETLWLQRVLELVFLIMKHRVAAFFQHTAMWPSKAAGL